MCIDKKTGIWLTQNLAHWFDQGLANALAKFFRVTGGTVADFGCGLGKYVDYFNKRGIHCSGFDGNPLTERITKGLCKTLDLSVPVVLKRFDWIVSLEVGEHIPRKRESVFLRNLYKNSRKGIVLSWAIPGQGGDGHVNERPNEYIKNVFKELNFKNDIKVEEDLRQQAALRWMKNTVMVFVRNNPESPE